MKAWEANLMGLADRGYMKNDYGGSQSHSIKFRKMPPYKDIYKVKKRRTRTKYLVIGIIFIFLTLITASTYSDIPQLEQGKKQIENMFHSSIPMQLPQKPIYYCNSTKDATVYICNCEESVVILDTESMTFKIDITPKNGDCRVVFTMTRCVFPDFTGKSMTCNCFSQSELYTLSKFIFDPDESAIIVEPFKYCEGSLKDEYFRQIRRIF